MKINIAHFLARSQAEGPGWRAALWVQGCPILCKGCINQEMLPFIDRHWVEVEALVTRILSINDIEGITFLGGEPFAQADALAEVAQQVRHHGLSVMTFTGYTLEELYLKDEAGVKNLLAHTDLLISGPFIQERFTDKLPWIGSDNQEYHFLTERYRHMQSTLHTSNLNSVEVRLRADELHINGLLNHKMMRRIRDALKSGNIQLSPYKGDSYNE